MRKELQHWIACAWLDVDRIPRPKLGPERTRGQRAEDGLHRAEPHAASVVRVVLEDATWGSIAERVRVLAREGDECNGDAAEREHAEEAGEAVQLRLCRVPSPDDERLPVGRQASIMRVSISKMALYSRVGSASVSGSSWKRTGTF